MRQYNKRLSIEQELFQFTHPGRGATNLDIDRKDEEDVSIHAPREGCDRHRHDAIASRKMFQFTHPGRGATSSTHRSSFSLYAFQFTHPGRGATRASYALYFATFCFNSRTPGGVRLSTRSIRAIYAIVSIHAPREGCDMVRLFMTTPSTSFNSRTPGGVRHIIIAGGNISLQFQFTHPGRGAT